MVAIEKQETIVVESKNTQALKYPNIMVKIEEQGTEFLNFKVTRQKKLGDHPWTAAIAVHHF